MKITEKIVLIVFTILFTIIPLNAQQGQVQGKVTAFNTINIAKAEITVKKTNTKVLTDSLGLFTIECKIKDKLSVSAAGFKTKTIKVKNLNGLLTINLEIAEDESDIDLAIANGHLNENNKASATKYFNLQNSYGFGYTNMIDLIKGKFPQISYVNDEFLLRGSNSISSGGKNGALIVLNGSLSNISTLKSLVVTEVKSIKILSGVEAARFGSGGGNGVISIQLKSQ